MIRFENVTFTYPDAPSPVLQKVRLHVPAGALALVAGPSGAGKSTFLRCLNGLVPHFSGGQMSGSLLVDGLDPVQATPQRMSRHVGFVFQDPESQFVVDRVEDEVAFALENAGVPAAMIAGQLDDVLGLLGLQSLRQRRLDTLSGGERQRVAIASALALRPRVLALDEPTSQLDPQGAEDVLGTLERLKGRLGLTVILVEHRLERVLPFTDLLVYVLPDGEVLAGKPRQVLPETSLAPPLVALGKQMNWDPLPLTIAEVRARAGEISPPGNSTVHNTVKPAPASDRPVLRIQNLTVRYGKRTALEDASFELWPGEILAVLGHNGAGKTTLLRCLVGLNRPSQGSILLNGRDMAALGTAEICRQVGYLPQDPSALLFAERAIDELTITLRNHRLEEQKEFAQALLERLGLGKKSDFYPRDLSVGERQRVALGAVTVTRPLALLLDEPTRGLDYDAKKALSALLEEWRAEGIAVMLVTHDVELAAASADRVLLLERGRVAACGNPAEVFRQASAFQPQMIRAFPDQDWLTPEEAARGLRINHS